jgi:hypothetical protein
MFNHDTLRSIERPMIRSNKDDRKGDLAEIRAQLELSQEIARIALKCPTCREILEPIITRFQDRKNKELSDSSSQEVSQTELNPNNNAAGIADSYRVRVSDGIASNGAGVIDSNYTRQYK